MKLLYKKEYTDTFGWSVNYTTNDTLIDGWEDISSIENWDLYSSFIAVDYKVIRMEIFNLVWTKMLGNPINFGLLNDNEKFLASSYFCIPTELRNLVHTTDEQIEFGKIFDEKSTNCRINRFKHVRSEILNRMTWGDAMELLTECKDLIENYYQGREGTLEGDGVGLFDYILSRVGTIYEHSGLLSKTYVIIGFNTITEFSDILINILKNGKY